MDGAKTLYRKPFTVAIRMHRCVGMYGGMLRTLMLVTTRGASARADLGGSSEYSNENFEGRRGERFH